LAVIASAKEARTSSAFLAVARLRNPCAAEPEIDHQGEGVRLGKRRAHHIGRKEGLNLRESFGSPVENARAAWRPAPGGTAVLRHGALRSSSIGAWQARV
jgi:hypothetical protein